MLLKVMKVLIILKFKIFFNPELQLKDFQSAIKNRQNKLFSELKEFKLVATLVLDLKI